MKKRIHAPPRLRASPQIAPYLSSLKKPLIDDRQWLLTEVQAQRLRLNDIIENIPGVIWEIYGKPPQRIHFISRRVIPLLGFTMQTWKTKNFWLRVIHPEDREQVRKKLNEIYKHKKRDTLQFRWVAKSGKIIWIESYVSVAVDQYDNPIGMRGASFDITKRYQAEQAVAASESKFRHLFELAPDVVYSIDLQGRITSLNPTFELLTGWKVKDWIGKHFLPLIHPDDQKAAKEQFILGLQKKVGPYQLRVKLKKGGYIAGEFRGAPYFESGILQGKIGIARDITERIEIEKRKDEFISMASHELKTPVTSLKLYTQLLQKQMKSVGDTVSVRALSKMDSQIDRLTYLISDLLDLSRIQAGKLTFRYDRFPVMELIKEVIDDIQPTSPHQIKLQGTTQATWFADRDRISQVLINLLTNAIKYSPQTEKVIVRVRESKGQVIIAVRDFGIGIAKEHQAKIFDRFYQITSPSRKVSSGLGIGLYISQEIISRHKGELWVESREGKGATFSFSLPIATGKKRKVREKNR